MKSILFPIILILFISPCFAQKSKLKALGTVVAEERLFGHIYSDKAAKTKYFIVRLDRIIDGQEQSRYVLIQRSWKLENYPAPIDNENETQWEFSLEKKNGCSKSLRELQFAFFADDNNKPNGLLPRLRRKQGAEAERLPFNETLPCYRIDDKNSKINRSFTPRPTSADTTGNNLFVLEDDLIENETDAPLKISWLVNGGFALTNFSSNPINRFQLGCVIKQGNTIEILSKMPETKANLETVISQLTPKGSDGTTDNMMELYKCYQSKAKLTVVETTSKDGTVWRIK
jgi:hypothetical protein